MDDKAWSDESTHGEGASRPTRLLPSASTSSRVLQYCPGVPACMVHMSPVYPPTAVVSFRPWTLAVHVTSSPHEVLNAKLLKSGMQVCKATSGSGSCSKQ